MSGIIFISSSDKNIKTIDVDINFENKMYIVNKYNWISDDDFNDTFEIIINNGICTCKRTDSNCGWNMQLLIKANIIIDSSTKNIIPIFFINLKKDTERLQLINNLLHKIFDSNNIYRIEGVKHDISLEGCRLAHINANIAAINKGFEYYIIAEDDIEPLVDINDIITYINKSILFKPDLVLFEQHEHLERDIKMAKKYENMYRIYQNGNNAGCYLCSRNFGIKLVSHWINSPGIHVDHSWQHLWFKNEVFFHKPQLFRQREGFSNQNNNEYRGIRQPFNWELFDNLYPDSTSI